MADMVTPLAGEIEKGETKKAILACNDYLRMGAGRSLQKLHQKYIESALEKPPTQWLRVLADWSTKYAWVARANEYDATLDDDKNSRRRAVMEQGLALDYARVNELTEIYNKLKAEFVSNGLWYTDIKLSARGDTVDVEVFNKPLIDSLRGVLDDMAKETGGRKQKTEINGAVNLGIVKGYVTVTPDDWDTQPDSTDSHL